MAASSSAQGFKCQFLDSVPDEYYCKLCTLVARKIFTTDCCGESYCYGCISPIQQANKPCPNPECDGQEKFEIFPLVRHQKKILSLQVCCLMKESECSWQGKLEELDAHLDPDKGDCEYIDVQCPLKCDQKVTRKNITKHVANECVQRDYICPYCAFKATYEIVTAVHYPECSYYPLPCPNRCGVTCERPTMEDHMKICPLEVVECEFKHVGCEMKFVRDEKEEHMREKSQTHLTMMATSLAKMQEGFQQLLLDKEKSFEEKLKAQAEKLQEEREQQKKDVNEKLKVQKEKFETERKQHEKETLVKLREQEMKFEEKIAVQVEKFEKQREGYEQWKTNTMKEIENVKMFYYSHRTFKISIIDRYANCKRSSPVDQSYGPSMYTHINGYKFFIGIEIEYGIEARHIVSLYSKRGESDGYLNWPVTAKFTIELINHFQNGENRKDTKTIQWSQLKSEPEDNQRKRYSGLHTEKYSVLQPTRDYNSSRIWTLYTLMHSELKYNPTQKTHFSKNDALHFRISDIQIVS